MLCDTVLCLVGHLKRKGRDEDVFKVAEEVFDTTQVTTEYTYKMRFCIYLMYHKLDEYVQLNLSTGGKEYEFNHFHLFNNDSPYVEKTMADEADYLLADDMANLKKIVREEKSIYTYMVFFSKYVNSTSDAAKCIVKYLGDNKDKIDDANILLFLKKVGDQKTLLKELIMANIDNANNEMSATVARIIASDFSKDEDIKQLLKLDDWKEMIEPINRVSHNCSLNTNVNKLKEIYAEYKGNGYRLDNSYASYNFIFSMMDENEVVANLKYYLTELQDTFIYRIIVTSLLVRLKRDKAIADKLFDEMLLTDDQRMRIGFYSILSSAGVKSAELREWRLHQRKNLDEYGHVDAVANLSLILIDVGNLQDCRIIALQLFVNLQSQGFLNLVGDNVVVRHSVVCLNNQRIILSPTESHQRLYTFADAIGNNGHTSLTASRCTLRGNKWRTSSVSSLPAYFSATCFSCRNSSVVLYLLSASSATRS